MEDAVGRIWRRIDGGLPPLLQFGAAPQAGRINKNARQAGNLPGARCR
ncbi:MAG: hypothetical protein ACTHL1_07770 [Burkholderiaceae bacterium]